MKPILFALLLDAIICTRATAEEINLVQNPGFEIAAESASQPAPANYELQNAASWGSLGTTMDFATKGIILPGNSKEGGEVSQLMRGVDQAKGRWLSFRFRGLAQSKFTVDDDSLKMKIEFYSKNGTNYLDCASRTLYSEIEHDRQDLTVNGDYHKYGAAVWRTYELEELIPFPEVDAVKISVSYVGGSSTESLYSSFLIDDFSLVQHAASQTGRVDPANRIPSPPTASVDEKTLISLGGRWYYAPAPGETVSATTPVVVTEKNSDRLYYKSDRFINPFLNNMTSWLRPGHKDAMGNIVTKDTFLPDNVVVTFKGDGFLTMYSKNIPNHPTAKFPGFNPSYIQEKNQVYRIPLEPVIDPNAIVTDAHDTNRALPMGPIGVAINGVAFYNPFDATMGDASNIMDYCCGHSDPGNFYHYHKYPICVNTPFVDKGDAPSEVIGFAFDGLPIYGPYQDKGIMAKDSETNPLNAFNACNDEVRGWHYNVTPGKFPYIIGGYFAKAEPSNFMHGPGHPPGGGFGLGAPPQ